MSTEPKMTFGQTIVQESFKKEVNDPTQKILDFKEYQELKLINKGKISLWKTLQECLENNLTRGLMIPPCMTYSKEVMNRLLKSLQFPSQSPQYWLKNKFSRFKNGKSNRKSSQNKKTPIEALFFLQTCRNY